MSKDDSEPKAAPEAAPPDEGRRAEEAGGHYVEIQGIRVPALGLGTWQMAPDTCRRLVEHALEVGYRHVDTAQMYQTEAAVGEAVEASEVLREDVWITTKLWLDNLEAGRVADSTQESLERLRTDYVDLLLIHWPSGSVPLSETLEAMQQLQDAGAVRHIGVSNFTPRMLEEALELAPILCIQTEYHPFLAQRELLSMAREHDLLLTAYSPLARGAVLQSRTLREIGRRHGKSAAQVALRWLLQQPNVAAVPKTAHQGRCRSNFEIFDFELTEDEMRRIFALERSERLVSPAFAP